MRYGLDVCTLGEYAEPDRVVELARAGEAAGWEAVFVWDHLAFAWGTPSAPPWTCGARKFGSVSATCGFVRGPGV